MLVRNFWCGNYFGVWGVYGSTREDEPRLISRGRPQISVACIDPVEFCSGRLGIVPDLKQAEVLRSTAKRGLLNCARQWGKSTITAAKAVHRAWTRTKSLVLFCAPTERQSGELLTKAAAMVQRLGVRPRGDGKNRRSLLLPNGSRIVALPGTDATVRGFSAASLILIDEASRVPDALYDALRPMLLVGDGDLWMMSTPYGKRGFFYESWAHGGVGWHRTEARATENPRIRPEQLERERGATSAAFFEQDYLCQFVDGGGQLFGTELVEASMDDSVPALAI